MQPLWQERGEVGLVNAGAEFALGVFNVLESIKQVPPQFVDGGPW
jgi:hypothetical protein